MTEAVTMTTLVAAAITSGDTTPSERNLANFDSADQFRARADDDIVTQGGVAFGAVGACAAERYALIEHDVGADFGGLADHYAHAVVDKETRANLGAGVNLDAGNEADEMHDSAWQQRHT